MGYKSRSNYALGASLTQERFDQIFKEGERKNGDLKPSKEKEGKRANNNRSLEQES